MADVVIVGAGIIGCAVAEALVAQRAAVHVVDPLGVGRGATQASAGMLTPYHEGRHVPALEVLGERSLALYPAFVDRLAALTGERPLYVRSGSLELALNDEEAATLQDLAGGHAARGIASQFLQRGEVRQLEPEAPADCVAALHVPGEGYASASQIAAAAWRACETVGARFTRMRVERIASGPGGRIHVIGDTGSLEASRVVLAAGTWAGQIAIADGPPLPVRPVRGQLLELRWPPPALARIVSGPRCYAVPWPDGTLLAGATSEDVGFDDRATVAGVRDLLDGVSELLPRTWRAEFTRVRVGLRPSTPDALPIIGTSARVPGLIYATGHFRNGVLLAPLTADLVTTVLGGHDDPALHTTAPSRFGAY